MGRDKKLVIWFPVIFLLLILLTSIYAIGGIGTFVVLSIFIAMVAWAVRVIRKRRP